MDDSIFEFVENDPNPLTFEGPDDQVLQKPGFSLSKKVELTDENKLRVNVMKPLLASKTINYLYDSPELKATLDYIITETLRVCPSNVPKFLSDLFSKSDIIDKLEEQRIALKTRYLSDEPPISSHLLKLREVTDWRKIEEDHEKRQSEARIDMEEVSNNATITSRNAGEDIEEEEEEDQEEEIEDEESWFCKTSVSPILVDDFDENYYILDKSESYSNLEVNSKLISSKGVCPRMLLVEDVAEDSIIQQQNSLDKQNSFKDETSTIVENGNVDVMVDEFEETLDSHLRSLGSSDVASDKESLPIIKKGSLDTDVSYLSEEHRSRK